MTQSALVIKHRVIGFDSRWQSPAKTEKHAFDQCLKLFPTRSGYLYAGFPWATLIDLIQTKNPDSVQLKAQLGELKKIINRIGDSIGIITVCQHIYAERYMELFESIGVTHLFLVHSETSKKVIDNISIHPFPIFPVQIIEPLTNRPWQYLFSFIGAYSERYYRTAARQHIFTLLSDANNSSRYIEQTREWHYEKEVYEVQLKSKVLPKGVRENQEIAEKRYRDVLQASLFVLCPSGSGPNSIRLWEAIVSGVIPVVLADGLRLPGIFDLWRRAAVFCREDAESIAELPKILEMLSRNNDALISKRQALAEISARYGPERFVSDILELAAASRAHDSDRNYDIVVLDPGLRDLFSHHHVLNTKVANRCVFHRRRLTVYCHKKAAGCIVPYDLKPVFADSIYDDRADIEESQYDTIVQRMADTSASVLEASSGMRLVLHTASAALIQALSIALMREGAAGLHSVALQLMFHPKSIKGGDTLAVFSTGRYITALRSLANITASLGVSLEISTSCKSFADFYSAIGGLPINIHPYALWDSGQVKDFGAKKSKEVDQSKVRPRVLLFSGDLKMDKGLEWTVNLLNDLLAMNVDVDFWLHIGNNRFNNPEVNLLLAKLQCIKKSNSSVHVVEGTLSDASWDQLISSMDLVTLNYSPISYQYKTSGVFYEVLRHYELGVDLFVTKGTWLQNEAETWGLDVCSVEYNSTSVFLSCFHRWLDRRVSVSTRERVLPFAFKQLAFGIGNDEFLIGSGDRDG